MEQTYFLPNQDQLIKFLFEDMSICNWSVIASRVSEQVDRQRTIDQCKNRYLAIYNPTLSKTWSANEERQLYKLHDQYGNKWATIANHFIGKTDNCVKNHLYSKLRKSLRALNKIARTCYKKQLKQISNTVLYKLTEATEEKFKTEPCVEANLLEISQRLKSGLLEYQVDDEEISKGKDYARQKQFIKQLLAFNKDYKKKSKKDKTSGSSYTENIKKALEKKREIHQRNEKEQIKSQCQIPMKSQIYSEYSEDIRSERSFNTSEKQVKKLTNVLIQAPSVQQTQFMKEQSTKAKTTGIQDILKASGILENGDHEGNIFRREYSQKASSRRSSFSNVSESSYTDMFGEQFGANFKQFSEMEGDSEIFQKSQP